MRKIYNKFVFAALAASTIVLSTTSCLRKKPDYGPMTTKTVSVQPFNAISVDGIASVTFEQADSFSVSVSGRALVVASADISVYGGVLHIGQSEVKDDTRGGIVVFNYNRDDTRNINIKVTGPHLTAASVSGNAELSFPGKMQLDSVRFDVSGNSELVLNQLASSFVGVETSGNSSADLFRVTADGAGIETSGNSDLRVNFENTGNVEAYASGNSDVVLTGRTHGTIRKQNDGNADITDNTSQSK